MRFVWAVVAFVLATLLIGAGIAQRTLFVAPSEETIPLKADASAPFMVLDSDVLGAHPGAQTLLIDGDGTEVFAAYARTADLQAWLAGTSYNEASLDEDEKATVEFHEAVAPTDGTEAPAAHTPAGSDLWLESFTDPDQLSLGDVQIPDGVSVLIASDGTAPAPTSITVSWPLDTSTPWVGPLITAGVVVLLIGIVLYILAIRHQRRGRGPRRKGPGPLPQTEPISIEQAKEQGAIEAGSARVEHRAPRQARLLALPAAVLSVALVSGCSADSWPQLSADTPSPSPSATLIAPDNQKPPAVSEAQAERILKSISETVSQADTNLDIDAAATRLDGPALEARRTDYVLRAAIADRAMPLSIPTDSIEVMLPQATDSWPRTVLILSKSTSDDTVPPVILTMTQSDPWANYKVSYLAQMYASAEVPNLAAPYLGTTLITDKAAAFLELSPSDLAASFSDVIDNGDQSTSSGLFDDLSTQLAQAVRDSRQKVVQGLIDKGAESTSEATFDAAPGDATPVALATLDSGAIVTTYIVDTQVVKPSVSDAEIRFEENPEAKALTGKESSQKGVTTTYGLQLFFSIPAQGTDEPIKLLAVHQDILSVEEIQ